MPQSKNRKKKRKVTSSHLPIQAPTISQVPFNPEWLRKLAIWTSVAVIVPLFIGIGVNWFYSSLTNGVLLQPVGLSAEKSLLFKLKNNLPFDIVVADFSYQPDKIAVRMNRDIYGNEVYYERDGLTGKTKGLRLKENKGIDVMQIENRLKGLSIKSGDEINIRFSTDFPTDSSEEKLSFQISFGITPRHWILSTIYSSMKFFTFIPGNEKGFFLLEQGIIQSISQKQFQKDIETM